MGFVVAVLILLEHIDKHGWGIWIQVQVQVQVRVQFGSGYFLVAYRNERLDFGLLIIIKYWNGNCFPLQFGMWHVFT